MAQIAYTEKWPRCKLCHLPSFGAFVATFKMKDYEDEEFLFLCAECGFGRAWDTWSKLKSLRLEVIFKLPEGKAPKHHISLPDEDFVASNYNATFLIDGDRFTGAIGNFATEWAALERARQISHLTAKSLHQKDERIRSHWQLQTGISRLNGKEPHE